MSLTLEVLNTLGGRWVYDTSWGKYINVGSPLVVYDYELDLSKDVDEVVRLIRIRWALEDE